MDKYVYPKLPATRTTPFFRIGGNGLANCLFVYAKAIVASTLYDAKLIAPTWFNISVGTYIRNQKDKRHYFGLFNNKGEIAYFEKLRLLMLKRKTVDEQNFQKNMANILVINDFSDYFKPLLQHHRVVREYILDHVNPSLLKEVDKFDFSDSIAVHVRLGDFSARRRVPLDWYVKQILRYNKKRILIFSDGSDEELKPLLAIQNTQRVYFGGAIQDIIAISRCSYLIGSDSSFSAWGAYLGQVPCTFFRLGFGNVLLDSTKQLIEH